jgi:predicted permease
VSGIAAALAAEYPDVQRDWTADAFNARTDIPDGRSKIFYGLLQGSVFFVLLIACANITNLLLARAQERRREIGLRTVLGAGRWRIARQLLTESGLLVLLGSTAGLGLGWVGIRAMALYFGTLLPPNYAPRMDGTVVAFTLGLSVLAGLIFGLAPAIQALRTDQAEVMKEGGRGSTRGRSRKILTRGLVVAEIALSLVALGGGTVLVQAFLEMQASDGGFDDASIVTARLTVPRSKYPDSDTRGVLMDQVLDEARALSGVRAAALVNALPRGLSAPTDTFRIAGQERDGAAAAPRAVSLKASPGYADALGIAVLQGRFFEPGDRAGQDPVAVVNRSFSERWFAREDPVDRFVTFEGSERRIIGVVEDVQQVLIRTPGVVDSEAIYIPAAQAPMADYTVVASALGDPLALKEPLRLGLQSLDPDLTLSQVLTLDEVVEQFFAGINVFNVILGGFGLIGILLASLGTYGVLAYQVTQRRQEIGIRMAVGASNRDVLGMVTRQGLWMAVIGLALGGALLVPLIRLFATLLEGFASVKGETGFLVAALLFAVTVAASLIPARRAATMDPVRALGHD